MPKLPAWLIKRTPKQENLKKIRNLLNDSNIHTVCESAHCPNLGECYSCNTLTFMILGDICTRSCGFCAVKNGIPKPVDETEAERVSEAAEKLGLKYVVVTSVTRDDLPDGGASQFAKVTEALKKSGKRVEVLIPDFQGNIDALRVVLEANPDVLNHNVETVPRLYPIVRPQANYQRSLEVLRSAKEQKMGICTKSGFMVGLSEKEAEVIDLLRDLRDAGCDIVTIGQYLAPSPAHLPVQEYLSPETFEHYRKTALEMGFSHAESGPFVRSSYHAEKVLNERKSR